MRRLLQALAGMVALAVPLVAEAAESRLHRLHDPVVVRVATLPGIAHRASGGLHLYRWAAGTLEPIPAQFDARARDGDIDVWGAGDFVLDDDDELVFMAKDVGARAPHEALPSSALLEVEVEDPVDGSRGWAYLLAAPGAPAAAAYVVLDGEQRRARSSQYDVEYADGRNFFTGMRISPAAGGDGANFLRQTRMLGEPRFSLFFTDVGLKFTEKNSIVRVEGIKNGPVRSIRRVHLAVDLGGLLPELPSGTVYTLHYLTSFATPTRISIPWIALQALVDFRFENVLEFEDRALPLHYYDAVQPDGVSLTTDANGTVERERDHEWYAVSGEAGTFLQVFLLPDEWRAWGIARGTVLRRGRNGDGTPVPCAAGFSLLHMTRLERPGMHQLRQATIVLPRPFQPGDEAQALAMFHQPLRVTAHRLR